MQINGVLLKDYQARALGTFTDFLEACSKEGLRNAYPDFSYEGAAYKDPEWSNPSWKKSVPAVTLRAPTGAGKTILTSAFLGAALGVEDGLPEARVAIIAVPSKELIRQTARKYNNPQGMERRILEHYSGKPLRVITRDDALRLRPADLDNNFVLLITTFAGFRREEKDSLRVYRENGALLPFFEGLTGEQEEGLLFAEDISPDTDQEDRSSGKPVPSLVNLLRLERPLVAIDESHQSQSKLSWDMIDSFAPRFVLETTATPRPGANVLINIPALEVKAEAMLRLPINLIPSDGWQDALHDARDKRVSLEKKAKQIQESLRPIVLVQTERADHEKSAIDDGRVSVFDALQHMEKSLGIPRAEIAVRTGKKDDLQEVDLLDPDCPVRYIITVKAAAEGWDCPYAYILCALAVGNSKIGVEQVIGRIIRQHRGTEKSSQDLNEAYVFTGTPEFEKTAKEVVAALENSGYSKEDLRVKEDSSSSTAAGADEALLRPQFKDITKPLLALRSAGETILEGSTQLLEEATRQGKSIPLDAVSHNLQKPKQSETAVSIDIDSDTGARVETETKIDRSKLSSRYEEITLQQIKDSLKRKIKVSGVKHEDIKVIVDRTIDENFSDWGASQMHMRLGDIRIAIISGIRQRVAELTEEMFRDSISKGDIIPDERPFPERIYQKTHPDSISSDKHLYDSVAPMNKEEVAVARVLEGSPKVRCWFRIPENAKGSYYLPGFYGRHFPDFLAIGEDGKVYLCEYKGEQLLGSRDTGQKERIGDLFTKAYGASRAEYFMVSAGAKGKSEAITPEKLAEILS